MSGDDRKSVLVIDDDPTQQIIVADVLEQLGRTNVLTAVDGDAARAIMQEQSANVGLIMCDLHMPDFDGVEFLLHLKDAASQIPVMIVSGASDQLLRSAEQLATAHDLNLVAAFSKPMDIDQLEAVLSTHSVC
ncbi:MAG: response regulator [Hyphomicrobiaceae bacterium]